MRETMIGKIESIKLGFGGYQDAMFGVSVTLSGKGWSVGDFKGTWGHEPDKFCKWTAEDQSKVFAETTLDDIGRLKGKPIEAEFEDGRLKSWRILTEVL